MAEKDLSKKYLESFPDVFVDIYNTLLFQENYIKEEELEKGPTESIYKSAKENIRNQFRDTTKYTRKGQYNLALLGIENQGEVDLDMPIRVMGYDYASYREQIDESGKRKYPVITIVLNFSDDEWKTPLSLYDILDIPEKLLPYVNDYKIHIFNIAFLPEETRNKFKSDFKVVADFFTEKRLGKYEAENHPEIIQHEEAVLNMFRVFTNDENYDKIESELIKRKKKGESITMCTFVEEMMNKGKEEGIEQGIQQGKEEAKIDLVKEQLNNYKDEELVVLYKLDIETIRAIRKEQEMSLTQ